MTRVGSLFASARGPARALAYGALGLALCTGCGAHYLTRGVDLYAGGHYVEAAEVFERTERRLQHSSQAECARYGLYRGATLLALGDTPRAMTWLDYSKAIVDKRGDALSDEDRDMLGRALTLIATRRTATPPVVGGGSTIAARPPRVDGQAPADAGEIGN